MISVTVKSRAYRALRHLSRFTSGGADLDRFGHSLQLGENEEIVGVYYNPQDLPTPNVVISSLGVYLIDAEATVTVPFSEIQSVSGPTEKSCANKLVVELRGGEAVTLPILGGHERFRDVFAVQRFLDRVIADMKSGPAT